MRASRLLILAFVSIIEISSADNPVDRQISHRSSASHYPKSSAVLDDENSVDERAHASSDDIQEKMFRDRRYRHKKKHAWPDAIRHRRPHRGPKRRGRPKKMHLAGTRPMKGRSRNPEYSQRPSRYLEPPRSMKSTYELYSPREIPLADQPISPEPTPAAGGLENHRAHAEAGEDVENTDRPAYIRDHAPEQQAGATDDIETDDAAKTSRESSSPLPESPKDRIEFHIHGHEGPETYIFGYDTGVGNNRQYRLEERHEDGSVTGHYGYVDARGKLRKVRYKASPTQGYVEKLDRANEEEA